MRSLKIISDGTMHGTMLVDADSGEVIKGVTSITWRMDVRMLLATATVELQNILIDVEAPRVVSTMTQYYHATVNGEPVYGPR